jgi:hypothetical protein
LGVIEVSNTIRISEGEDAISISAVKSATGLLLQNKNPLSLYNIIRVFKLIDFIQV